LPNADAIDLGLPLAEGEELVPNIL
jgi:hypothetical protein